MLNSGHKNRRTRSLKTSVAPSKTKNALIVSLEEDSKSHIPRGEMGRKCSSESTLVHKATAENNFEEELNYGLRRCLTGGSGPMGRLLSVRQKWCGIRRKLPRQK